MLASRMARALFLLVCLSTPAAAQSGAIAGRVSDSTSGEGLAGAGVAAVSGDRRVEALTGNNGSYRLANLPPGTYVLEAQSVGFSPRRVTGVVVTANGTTTVNVALVTFAAQLNTIVVSAGRVEEKLLETPSAIQVVEAREIAERPSVTPADHLKEVAGLDVSQGGVAQSNIVARGFNNIFSGSMLVLQDYRFAGVPSLRVNVPLLFTGTNEDIERIEVLLGPASALYGPNSANGVLHIITKSPFDSQGTTLTLDAGERSYFRGGFRYAGTPSEQFGFKLSGEYLTAEDWKYQDPGEPTVFPAQAPPGRAGQPVVRDFDLEKSSGEARMDIRPRSDLSFISTLGYTKIGSGIELTGANGAAQVKGWSYMNLQQRMTWGNLFAQVFLNSSNAGNDNAMDTGGTYLLRSGQPIVDKSRVVAAQIQHALNLNDDKQRFVYGVDYIGTNPRTGNTVNGRNEDDDDVTEVGGYVQSTTQLMPKLDALIALRLDNNSAIEGSQFSPRAALTFKPTPTENWYLSFNRAFSTPANFSYFLDLIQARNIGGSGFDVRAVGNPPKSGFQFARNCASGEFGGLCMKSHFVAGNSFVDATAASAFPGFVAVQGATITAGISGALQQNAGLPKAQADALAGQLVAALGAAAPTSAQIGTRVRYLNGTNFLQPSDVHDIAPLEASYNNTIELGYKGILGNRTSLTVAGWWQRRGDVGTPAALSTPNIFFDQASLEAYLAANLTAGLKQAGFPDANAAALGAGIGAALAATGATAPLGVITFDSPLAGPSDVLATYTTTKKEIDVYGLDLSWDYLFSQRWSAAATYSWVNKSIFNEVRGPDNTALALNAPDHKATVSGRFNDEFRGISFEVRGRYSNGFEVNSGVFGSVKSFTAPADPRPGVGSEYTYDAVPVGAFLDLQFAWRIPLGSAQQVTWSINANNVLDNARASFAGVPEIGRMVTTRLQYAF